MIENFVLANGKHPSKDMRPLGISEYTAAKNVCLMLPSEVIVLDVDDKQQSDTLLKICDACELSVRVIETTRGKHFYFRNNIYSKKLKSSAKHPTSIGIEVDVRNGAQAKKEQVAICVKLDGVDRPILRDVALESLSEFPDWLMVFPVRGTNHALPEIFGMCEGDGRNDTISKFIRGLIIRGLENETIRKCLLIIDKYVLNDPLGTELDTIMREETFIKFRAEAYRVANYRTPDGELAIDVVAKDYQEDQGIVVTQDIMYRIGEKNIYGVLSTQVLRNSIISHYVPTATPFEVDSIIRYITDRTGIDGNPEDYGLFTKGKIEINDNLIAFQNGIYDMLDNKFLDFNPKYFLARQAGTNYNPDITECVDVNNMLMSVFCEDLELIRLFWQMLGYCLTNNCKHQVLFIFSGSGSNGKSTLMKMIEGVFDKSNTSNVSLAEMENENKVQLLMDKMINLSYDNDSKKLQETRMLKCLSVGDPVNVKKLYKDPFSFTNKAKLIFAVNELPKTLDASPGFYRRLVIFPFNAKFDKAKEGFDKDIINKLINEEAKSYILNKALQGLKDLEKHGFVEPDQCKYLLKQYRINNDSVLEWLQDKGYKKEDLVKKSFDKHCFAELLNNQAFNKSFEEWYKDYVDWCEFTGNRRRSSAIFSKNIQEHFEIDTTRFKIDGSLKRYFINKE